MSTLFDIFGFLSVVLRGLDLVAQSILIGSVSFALFIAAPLAGDATREVRTIAADVRHCIQGAALAAVIAALQSPDHALLAIPALQARLDDEQARQASTRTLAFVPGSGALPPRNAYDLAWSEYNHHWAGLLVVLMGLAALAQRSGHAAWAKHWPPWVQPVDATPPDLMSIWRCICRRWDDLGCRLSRK